MSDILIKGMDMPKDIEPGLAIEFADGIDGKRYARLYHYQHGGLTEWREAVSIPSQTKADRIRAMTDEELAEFIGGDPMHDICPSDCFEDPDRPCKVCVLKWLKQEVRHDKQGSI